MILHTLGTVTVPLETDMTNEIRVLKMDELDKAVGGASIGPLTITGGNGTLVIGFAGVGAVGVDIKKGHVAATAGGKTWTA